MEDGLMGRVIWTSLDQLAVKLETANNEIDASVAKTNALVQEIVANQ